MIQRTSRMQLYVIIKRRKKHNSFKNCLSMIIISIITRKIPKYLQLYIIIHYTGNFIKTMTFFLVCRQNNWLVRIDLSSVTIRIFIIQLVQLLNEGQMRMMVYFKLMMVKCALMMVNARQWWWNECMIINSFLPSLKSISPSLTSISSSLTSISPSLTSILPSLAWSRQSLAHPTII